MHWSNALTAPSMCTARDASLDSLGTFTLHVLRTITLFGDTQPTVEQPSLPAVGRELQRPHRTQLHDLE